MNAVYDPSRADRAARTLGTIALTTLWALWQIVRLVLFAVLGTFEPVVRCVLSFAALGGFLTCALFYFGGPRGLHVSYGILLTGSAGCAVLLVFYEGLLRALGNDEPS